MPKPKKDETKKEFVSRCIPIVLDEGTAKDQKQAAAVCYSMWKQDKEKSVAFIKSRGDGKATVAGYGIVFGGEDLYGETFTKDTEFMLNLVPEKPVMFNHGLSVTHKSEDMDARFSVKNFLGIVKNASIKMDEFGLFIEAVLDESKEYAKQVLKLIEDGVIGWSSGSVPQLIEMDGKNIKRWPIVEFSLTHVPAEPRTIGVEHIRGLFTDAGLEVPEALLESDELKNSAGEEEGVEIQNQNEAQKTFVVSFISALLTLLGVSKDG